MFLNLEALSPNMVYVETLVEMQANGAAVPPWRSWGNFNGRIFVTACEDVCNRLSASALAILRAAWPRARSTESLVE